MSICFVFLLRPQPRLANVVEAEQTDGNSRRRLDDWRQGNLGWPVLHGSHGIEQARIRLNRSRVRGHDVGSAQMANVIMSLESTAEITVGNEPAEPVIRVDDAGGSEGMPGHGDYHLL